MKISNKKQQVFLQYLFLFFLILLTTYLVFTTLDIKMLSYIINIVNIDYILLGILCISIYILFEAYIINIIINSIHKVKSKTLGFKISVLGLYYNLVTPFASGAQPMQIYSLTKSKVPFSKSVAIITNKTVIFQTVVTIYCGILVFINLELLKKEMYMVMILVFTGIIMNTVMLILGILIVFSPNMVKSILNLIIKLLNKIKVFLFLEKSQKDIEKFIDDYNYSIKLFIKNKKVLIWSLLLTVIQLTSYFSTAYCIYRGFNLNEHSFWHILTLQVFLYMAISPIPTPGNVGATEVGFLTIFKNIFPEHIEGYAVFLYGGYVYYFMLIVTGIFTIYVHYKMRKYTKNNYILKNQLSRKT